MILGTWTPSMALREGKKVQEETSVFLGNINSFLTMKAEPPKTDPTGQHQYLIHIYSPHCGFYKPVPNYQLTKKTFLSRRVQLA